MKKLLAIVVLGLLTACSMEQSTKTITNCADNLYSKNNQNDVPDIINLMILKKVGKLE